MPLAALEPEQIGGMFGRRGSRVERIPFLGPLEPAARFLTVGALAALAVLVLATLMGVLVDPHGTTAAIGLVLQPKDHVRKVAMSLLEDPVGIIVLVVTLGTPLFCAKQVRAIHGFVQDNERNRSASGCPALAEEDRVTACIAQANRRFAMIGSIPVSLLLLIVSGLTSAFLYYELRHTGLLRSWNPTDQLAGSWRKHVYDGWWANLDHHPVLAVALCLLGWYMFYFLGKQLLMGVVFTFFARTAAGAGFGVTPNLRFDSDGYSGLRSLRRFMMWTYGSSLAHFVLALGVLVVWLPGTPATLFISLALFITNATVVIYPSIMAHDSALEAKIDFAVRVFADTSIEDDAKQAAVTRLWAGPNLPFRMRSTLTAATLYLFVPLFLAIVSTLLK